MYSTMQAATRTFALVPRAGAAVATVLPIRGMCSMHKSYPMFDPADYPTIPGTQQKCLMKKERAPGMWLETARVPEVGPHEIRIAVKYASICGTDVHIYQWDEWSQGTIPTPMITGHEYMGVIERVGEKVTGFQVGDRVTGEGHLVCGVCRNCRGGQQHLCPYTSSTGVNRPGAFAELFTLPASNAIRLHKNIQDEVGSIMDPLGNAVHCVLSFPVTGEDVLITGAGPIGCMAAAICRQIGARKIVVTDVNEYRLQLARDCGADLAVNVNTTNPLGEIQHAMKDLNITVGFDVGLEMSGNGYAFDNMLDTMIHGGKVALLGIPPEGFHVDINKIVIKGMVVKGIYGREMYETWYKMTHLLVNGLQDRLEPIITHRMAIEDFEDGFAAMVGGNAGKVVMQM